MNSIEKLSKIDDQAIHPKIESYFIGKGWEFFEFQRKSCHAFLAGQSGLIHSPTGTGKTLAAWLAPINQYLLTSYKQVDDFGVTKQKPEQPKGIQLLWITPMRALATDTEKSLAEVIEDLELPWGIQRRTGDSSTSLKAKQRKTLPNCLITTPESLSLLLSYAETAEQFKTLKSVVVDEWHELLGTKRGVQLELGLSRLRGINTGLVTWGLSATIGNISQAMDVLLGSKSTDKNRHRRALINANTKKVPLVDSIIPENVESFPWAGHMGLRLLPQVIQKIEQAKSTLVFTNTRSQAEIWFENILKKRPEWLESIALHHGSLAKKVRTYAEDGIREGRLKAVICTSSLDLGVDFSPVDQVIQIGSPKGIARLIQRAGRSGHSPGRTSAVVCVPTHALELVEIAAARTAINEQRIESRQPLTMSLDVLVQHCITLALGKQLFEGKTLAEIKRTISFAKISQAQWRWVLDFITRGGDALQHYPDYQKVIKTGRNYTVQDRRIARLHRSSIGTITSDAAMNVKFLKGGSLGVIEESFISKLKHKDVFLFNGRLLSLVQVKDMTAYVRLAEKKNRIVPRWQGGRLPLSTELADYVRMLLHPDASSQHDVHQSELKSIQKLLSIQASWSHIPKEHELLIETVKTREGYHIFFYPFAGRQVHEGLAALIAYRLTKRAPTTYTTSVNDYGFELLSAKPSELDHALLEEILAPDRLLEDLLSGINKSEMAKRQFRDIARIAGLIIQGHPGNRKSARQVQASSGILFDVLQNYDEKNLLLTQALEEVLKDQIDVSKLTESLVVMTGQRKCVQHLQRLSPLSFPLWAERLRGQTISSEKWQARVQRMIVQLERHVTEDMA